MEVSRSGYYRYLETQKKPKKTADELLKVEICALNKRYRSSYGSRRMVAAMEKKGYKIGRYKQDLVLKRKLSF